MSVCEIPQFVGGACECDVNTGELTKTFTRTCPPCAPADCVSELIEICTDGICPLWTEWTDSNACQADGTRVRIRDCIKDENESDECPGEGSEIIECTPKECIIVECDCDVDSFNFGTKEGVCSSKFQRLYNDRFTDFFLAGANLGTLDPTDCGCEVLKCANECVGWGEWTTWGLWMPECIDSNGGAEDTIFDDQDIHQPKRFRSRDCFVIDSTGTLTNEEVPLSKSLGECLFADKFETEFMEIPVICPAVELSEGEIETKV